MTGVLVLVVALGGPLFAAEPTQISSPAEGSFRLFRSGWVGPRDLQRLCRGGLREVLVLDGTATARECRWRSSHCPGLVVRFDTSQDPATPLSAEFLAAFDAWIAASRAAGLGVLFRCRHGWHRAGRLAAYYRMKHEGIGVEEAIREMHAAGRAMWRHRYLEPQVRALADHIAGRPCSVTAEHCVTGGGGVEATFAEDLCPAE